MHFLSPMLLWFLAAASLPVIIHLINKRRHKTVQWAAMQFLLKATRQSRGKKKLRHLLILTCRTLAIAALAFAAGRPILSAFTGWGKGTIDTVVLILDRSASMETRVADGRPSLRDTALEELRKTISDLHPNRIVLIDSATGQPQEVPTPDELPILSATQATDTKADFPTLMLRATELLNSTNGHSEIWIASDLQRSNWLPEDERWEISRAALGSLPQKPAIRLLAINPASTIQNHTLTLLNARRSGDELLIDLEVLRQANAHKATSIPLATNLNGASSSETLNLLGQSIRFQKRIPLPNGSAQGYGFVSLPADANNRDNVAYFAYGPNRPTHTLVVAPPGEAADYLALAAAPPGLGNNDVTTISPSEAQKLDLSVISTVLWAAPFPTAPAGPILHNFITSGGHVAFFPPGQKSAFSYGDIDWSEPSTSPPGKYFILQEWEHRDGPLADGIDGTPIPANKLKAIRRQIPTGDATPLATWDDGEVFLTRRIIDHGTAWYFGTLPDYSWSNLGDADVLLPAIQRIIVRSSSRFDSLYNAHVGDPEAALLPGETRSRLDTYSPPDPANANFTAGDYQLGERLIALNRPAEEDNPEITTRESLDHIFSNSGYTLLDQIGKSADTSLSRDIWRAFIIATLLLLISEALLSLPTKHPIESLAPAHPTVQH